VSAVAENARKALAEYRREDRDRPLDGEGSSAWWAGHLAGWVEALLSVHDARSAS
jgi:hypothetical protein